MERIKPQMIVEFDRRRGVTCPDLPGIMSCCDNSETPVVFDGNTAFEGVETDKLTVIGPENAKADFIKCGAGRQHECCIFLTAGPEGPCCERFSDLRIGLIFKKGQMSADREPVEPYPLCQKFGPSDPNRTDVDRV